MRDNINDIAEVFGSGIVPYLLVLLGLYALWQLYRSIKGFVSKTKELTTSIKESKSLSAIWLKLSAVLIGLLSVVDFFVYYAYAKENSIVAKDHSILPHWTLFGEEAADPTLWVITLLCAVMFLYADGKLGEFASNFPKLVAQDIKNNKRKIIALSVAATAFFALGQILSQNQSDEPAVADFVETPAVQEGTPPSASASSQATTASIPSRVWTCAELSSEKSGADWRESFGVSAGIEFLNPDQEQFANLLCEANQEEAASMVGRGRVHPEHAVQIASALSLNIDELLKRPRPEWEKRYAVAMQTFEPKLCSACADNVALSYAKSPDSDCGQLASSAIEGDEEALAKLSEDSQLCRL